LDTLVAKFRCYRSIIAGESATTRGSQAEFAGWEEVAGSDQIAAPMKLWRAMRLGRSLVRPVNDPEGRTTDAPLGDYGGNVAGVRGACGRGAAFLFIAPPK
jgi:hypothetical protein